MTRKKRASAGTATANEIARVIGAPGLLRLAEAFGGTTIRVPGRNDFSQALTREETARFIQHFRNESLYIPKLDSVRNMRKARQLASRGKTRAAIARELGVAERTVYAYLRNDIPTTP